MKHIRFFLFIVVICFLLAGCKSDLVKDIYTYAKSGTDEEAVTAFVALSNIALSQDELTSIVDDYSKETDAWKKYLYEFLLAKRTQEQSYIQSFIAHSSENLPLLIENKSLWVSVGSPVYQQLAYYAKNNDEALDVLFMIVKQADGANLAVVAEDLGEIYKVDPKRFISAADRSRTEVSDILKLLEEE